ncbi:putative MFS family arabinose efflux permease [Rhizobium sp. PP-F2F-G48]|uniref:MFS transporter n=1 Tax=Rhizobium sp. PP-F2F-G48 TaxID=2135651 RepID=UPI00104F46DA|nr:MFS transporter [Rhizobium sp. PP-F2F-G48]TCM54348.1 putative MFS family arabinose efflux permease [Rhizobium sp. PP-F2F-G48]
MTAITPKPATVSKTGGTGEPERRGEPEESGLPGRLNLVLAAACGLIVANLYFAQPLVGPIGVALGLSPDAAGLIVTLTQLGYGLGLLLIVPLGDLFENRKLILVMLGLSILAVLSAGLVTQAAAFLATAFAIGLCCVAVQIIVPYAAQMVPAAERGRAVGNVMSGLMVGIMLARPVSSFIAAFLPWHMVFVLSALAMTGLALFLARVLPPRVPAQRLGYGALIGSLPRLLVTQAVLRRRAAYQACMFAAFSLFWTVTPLLLASPAFGLTQIGIALFALAGAAGALAAPIAGRLADRGVSFAATRIALVGGACAFLVTHLAPEGSTLALAVLTLAAIGLDFAVSTTLVLGQRAIYVLGDEHRSRLNGLYMATSFLGGAVGSAAGAWLYAHYGWWGASLLGFALPAAALLYSLTERR